MCGRFTLATSADKIKNYFNIDVPLNIQPRYNIAPGQMILAVRFAEQLSAKFNLEFAFLKWGLIPGWMKPENVKSAGWINARIESVNEKPVFRQAFKKHRCLIIADGFYEWKTVNYGKKQPYYIHQKNNELFAMAGIWDSWCNEQKEIIESCAILTMPANKILSPIHLRMPVMLDKNNFLTWLSRSTIPETNLENYFKQIILDNLQIEKVGTQVNKPNYDSPDCIKPLK